MSQTLDDQIVADCGQTSTDVLPVEVAEEPRRRVLTPGRIAVGVLVLLSVLVRFYNINSPIVERHAWRQTETAFPVWVYLKEGISLHYQVPQFGPPWEMPFEFPAFQMSAAVLAKMTGMSNVDLACRLTGLLYFFVSAALLYLLVRHFFPGKGVAAAVLLAYVWSPFMVLWSRTAMIEFAAVTFALGYLYYFCLWLGQPRRWWLVALVLLLGCLGAVTKITTMAIVAPPMLALATAHVLEQLRREGGWKAFANFLKHSWIWLLAVAVMFVVPVMVGQQWVAYTDRIKAANPAEASGVSSQLAAWTYGTWAQRIIFMNWQIIFARMFEAILPYGVAALPAIAFIGARRVGGHARLFIYAAFVSVLFPIALFFNLYLQHDYYLCSVCPFLAVLAGFGAYHAWTHWLKGDRVLAGVAGTVVLIASFMLAWPYLIPAATVSYDNCIFCKIGEVIQRYTPEGEYVAMLDFDSDPSWLYYAKRKGYTMVQRTGPIILSNGPGHIQDLDPDDKLYTGCLADPRFSTLICAKQHDYIFSLWRQKQEVAHGPGIHIIKVSDYVGPRGQTGSNASTPAPVTAPPGKPKPQGQPWSFDPN